jgi:hypothetical protein
MIGRKAWASYSKPKKLSSIIRLYSAVVVFRKGAATTKSCGHDRDVQSTVFHSATIEFDFLRRLVR